ncbi:MAG: hypothetical protein WCQ64_07760 [Acidobacteriota bacterium]
MVVVASLALTGAADSQGLDCAATTPALQNLQRELTLDRAALDDAANALSRGQASSDAAIDLVDRVRESVSAIQPKVDRILSRTATRIDGLRLPSRTRVWAELSGRARTASTNLTRASSRLPASSGQGLFAPKRTPTRTPPVTTSSSWPIYTQAANDYAEAVGELQKAATQDRLLDLLGRDGDLEQLAPLSEQLTSDNSGLRLGEALATGNVGEAQQSLNAARQHLLSAQDDAAALAQSLAAACPEQPKSANDRTPQPTATGGGGPGGGTLLALAAAGGAGYYAYTKLKNCVAPTANILDISCQNSSSSACKTALADQDAYCKCQGYSGFQASGGRCVK